MTTSAVAEPSAALVFGLGMALIAASGRRNSQSR
jgi:hypothetical protein